MVVFSVSAALPGTSASRLDSSLPMELSGQTTSKSSWRPRPKSFEARGTGSTCACAGLVNPFGNGVSNCKVRG